MLHGGRELPLRVELALERHERNRARTHRLLVLLTSLALAALIFAADVRGGGGSSGAASRLHEVGSDSATVRWQQDRPSADEKVTSAADDRGAAADDRGDRGDRGGGGGSGAASSLHEVGLHEVGSHEVGSGSDSASVRWQENRPSAGENRPSVGEKVISAADVHGGGGGSGAASSLQEVGSGSDSVSVRWQQDRPSAGEKVISAADVHGGGGGSGAASSLQEVGSGSDSVSVRWQQDRPSAGEKVISAADVHGGGGGSGAASSLQEVGSGSDSASVRWQENCPSAGEVKVYVAVENAPKRRVEVLLFGGGGAGSTGHALLSSTAPDEAPRDAARRALADTLGLRGAADVEFVERLGNAKCTFVAYVRKTKLDAAARQTAALRGNHNLPLAEAAAASADERGRFWLDVVALAAQAGERRGVGADIGEDALRLETVLEPFILTAGLAPGAECPTKPGWRKP